jgi:tetratricopeptide (TPR) repeat protein
LSCREDVAVPGLLPQIENGPVVGRFRTAKVVAFLLTASVLVGPAGNGWPLLLSPATTFAAEASAFDTVATEIEKSVAELGYPEDVGQNLVRLVRDWKCEVWQQTLSQARQSYQQERTSAADVARVEAEVINGLYLTIRGKIAPCGEKEMPQYFYLPKVIKHKKAQCFGYSQLFYILGNSLGLRVTIVDVHELAFGRLPEGIGHVACCVELTDGKTIMVDVPHKMVSKSFVFLETYRAAGNSWVLKQRVNPLGIHNWIQVWNRNELAGRLHICVGAQYSETGDFDQAISCFTKAIACFTEAIELKPNDSNAYCMRGYAYTRSGHFANALSDYTKAIELKPTFAEAYCGRGTVYATSGELAKAIAEYNRAIAFKHTFADAYCMRGYAYTGLGRLTDAILDYTTAIARKPRSAEAYYGRGTAYDKLDQPSNALSDYTTAIALKPTFAEAYYVRGIVYNKSTKLANAIADFTTVIAFKPTFADAYYMRGNAYHKSGELANAIADFDETIRLRPKKAEAYCHRGHVYLKKGDLGRAIDDYNEAIRLKPKMGEAYYNRAKTYEKTGENVKAEEDFAEANTLGYEPK